MDQDVRRREGVDATAAAALDGRREPGSPCPKRSVRSRRAIPAKTRATIALVPGLRKSMVESNNLPLLMNVPSAPTSSPLADAVIWVPGGAGYLGRAVLVELERCGARPVCLDLPGRRQAAVTELGLERTAAVDFDFAETGTIEARCADLARRHGPSASSSRPRAVSLPATA